MSDEHKSSINWGGLTKGLLAGGAIVAGIAICCPSMLTGAMETLSKIGTAAPEIAKADPSLVERGISGLTSAIGSGLGTLLTKIAGLAIAITGVSYLLSEKKESNAGEHAARHHEAKESFALREEIRSMQNKMQTRMQLAGHNPAGAAIG